MTTRKRALISVSDKTGVIELARGLVDAGYEILSSGGTAATLAGAEVPVTEVSEVTGQREILGGRVKTLHPQVHGGILADRRKQEHLRELDDQGIAPIDLVVVNLYPFKETVSRRGVTEDEAIENIDIGGPAMVRAAAKNYQSVTVVVDPDWYATVLDEIRADGGVSLELRRTLALEAFAHTTQYDAAIVAYLSDADRPDAEGEAPDERWPQSLKLGLEKVSDLRYGENPHQRAAFYRDEDTPAGLAAAEQLHGKELSYNNLLDADAAYRLVSELGDFACVIVKHNNPCGVAVASSVEAAYERAYECDPTSAFGGIIALNALCTQAAAQAIAKIFCEVVVAPAYEEGALDALTAKKNLRLLRSPRFDTPDTEFRRVAGGALLQTGDGVDDLGALSVVTKAKPTDEQLADLRFAWTVAKYVKSNAIVLARDMTAVGIGAGQMSRVEATALAARRAGDRAVGTVCASDAFFPFRDGLDAAVSAGAAAVIQPGGSVRDEEVIAAADEHGIPMLFTGRRHFRH